MKRALLVLPAILLSIHAAFACGGGGYWPDGYLTSDPLKSVRPPIANQAAELKRIAAWAQENFPSNDLKPLPAPPAEVVNKWFFNMDRAQTATITAEMADLRAALGNPGEGSDAGAAIAAYEAARGELSHFVGINFTRRTEAALAEAEKIRAIVFPPSLPGEFLDYAEGVRSFTLGDWPAARACWERLLARPAVERKFRSVWAAYMLGRTTPIERRADSIPWWRLTRRLVRAGYADSLGLGLASFHREAVAMEEAGDFEASARLACAAHLSGDPNLESPSVDLSGTNGEAARAARSPVWRRLLTLQFLPDDWPDFFNQEKNAPLDIWLAALEEAKVADDQPDASRIAWAAYRGGKFDTARRWLRLAPAKEPTTLWLRGKLFLLDGQPAKAADCFARALPAFPTPDKPEHMQEYREWDYKDDYDPAALRNCQFIADFGAASLGRADFTQALTCFLDAGYNDTAHYIAERLLTRSELIAYVRQHCPAPAELTAEEKEKSDYSYTNWDSRGKPRDRLRYVLARRLARSERFAEAREFFPAEVQPDFDRYVAAWRVGHDLSRPPEERAAALWTAAKMQADDDFNPVRTMSGPDWNDCCWRHGTYPDPAKFRGGSVTLAEQTNWRYESWFTRNYDLPDGKSYALPVSLKERNRLRQTAVAPDKYLHFYYTAGDLAWEAAALTPRNTVQNARILLTAGRWLMYLDPEAADRFYKALVWRNWNLPVARDADQRRWFPPLDTLPPEPEER